MYVPMVERPIRVLLIESHHFTRLGLRSALAPSKAISVCAEADCPKTALQALEDSPVDVAVIGTNAESPPEGFAICRRLRETYPALKVLMLMSDGELDLVRGWLSSGAHAFGLKSVNPERLMAAIVSIFHGDTWVDAAIAECLFRDLLKGNNGNSIPAYGSNRSGETKIAECETVLTQRESEVLGLIVQGFTNQAIADRLVVSLATAKAHVRSILCKLSVAHRTEAAVEAIRRGLV